jgi:serine protease SohB
MDVLWETLGFAAKALVFFLTFAACTIVLVSLVRGGRRRDGEGWLRVRRLNDSLRARAMGLLAAMSDGRDHKRQRKELARLEKERRPRKVFVLDFKGDILASATDSLREEVTALCSVAGKEDEVVVRLESSGGAANNYGFAASQLARLRDRGIKLTACVDRVAASGGYMMACVADQILAAPFAIVGSIGVAAPMPNLHRLLDRMGVDYEDYTAGEYKRTLTLFGEPTEKGKKKFREQLEEVHQHFKDFVHRFRPALDVDKVATGEHWQGMRAVELGLVDKLMTSDDYLVAKLEEADIYQLSFKKPRRVRERLAGLAATAGGRVLDLLSRRS